MKRTIRYVEVFSLIFVLGLVVSCKKKKTSWNTDWSLPFVSDTLNLSNFHNDSTLNSFSSSNYLVNFERSLFDVSLNEFFELPDTTIVQSYSPTVGIGSIPPGFTFYNSVEAHEIEIPDVQLKKVIVGSGTIRIKAYNPIGTSAYYTIQMPGVEKNGIPFEETFFIGAGTAQNPATAEELLVLDGYEMDLRGEDVSGSVNISGYNILQTALSIMSDPNGVSVPLLTSDVFEFEAEIKNLTISYAQGYFGEQVFADTTEFTVPYLDHILSGGINLEDVPFEIEIVNGTKIPFSAKLTQLENTNYLPQSISLTSNLINSLQSIAPATGSWSSLVPSSHVIAFDNSNSNITSYLENLGHTHKIGYEIRMNPLGSMTGTYNEIFPNSRLQLKVKADFPLALSAVNLTISDTVSFSISSTSVGDLMQAEDIALQVRASNAFPFSGKLKLKFLDSELNMLHLLEDISTVESSLDGSVDPEDNLQKTFSTVEVLLNSDIVSDLERIDHVVIEVEFDTAGGASFAQPIPSNAFLSFDSNLFIKTLNSIP